MERRLKALQAAKAREADEVAQREANAKEREQEREQKRLEQENKQRELKKAEELANEKAAEVEAAKKQAEDQAKRAAIEAKTATKSDAPQRREFGEQKGPRPASPSSRKKIVTEMRDHLDVAAETKADDRQTNTEPSTGRRRT